MQSVLKVTKKILISSPFYGLFLSGLNKQFSDKIQYAGVALDGINHKMLINPDFWKSLSPEHQYHTMLHEVLHIVFYHTTDFTDVIAKYGHHLTNVGMDCEVESYIPEKYWDDKGTACFLMKALDLPKGKGTKWYCEFFQDIKNDNTEENSDDSARNKSSIKYNNMSQEEKEEIKNQLEDESNIIHDWFQELDQNVKDMIKSQVDHQLKETYKACGSIPGELKDALDEILKIKPPVYNWKKAFRRLLGNAYKVSTKITRRKESTRFEGNPGLRSKKKSQILVGIDTSGSVNSKELQEFFSEIYHIWKAGTKVRIIEWDTRIANEYEYKGKMPSFISGRGGTDPNPSLEYFNNHIKDYELFINFTDAYFFNDEYVTPKKQMYWVITSEGNQELNLPGIKIKIPKQQ